ncbi:MAG: hypothetical protein K0S19_1124 [Geminicoccaceae bacterium]|nr:hypothetical protein [Geminicoccaceae bacterium]
MFGSRTNLRHTLATLGTTMLTALSLACGGDDGGPAAPSGGDDVPAPATTGFRITNVSGRSAWYIYFKACGTEEWGEDRLGSSNVLSNGESFTSPVPAGCYDVLALTDTSEPPYYQIHLQQQSVAEGQVTSLSLSTSDWQAVVSPMHAGLAIGRK